MGNNHVKLYEIWTNGSGEDVVLRKSLWMDAGRTKRPITIAHLEASGELKIKDFLLVIEKWIRLLSAMF